MSNISQSVTSLRSLKFSRRAHPRSSTPAFPKNPVPAYRVFERRPAERFAGAPPSGIGRRTKTFTGEAGGTKRPRDYGLRDYCDRRCSGGKPVAHPLHRYITYEKWRFSTRYTPVTCRYTGAARGVVDMPTAAAGLAPGGNRRHTRYTVTLPMRNGAFRPVTYPLHAVTPDYGLRDYGPRDHCGRCRYTDSHAIAPPKMAVRLFLIFLQIAFDGIAIFCHT